MYRYVKCFNDRVINRKNGLLSLPLGLYTDHVCDEDCPENCVPVVPPGAYQKDGDDQWYLDVPWKYEICNVCDGHGTHVNRNIDGNGITAEEWDRDWDDEDREMYFSGEYDVRCEAGCNDGKIAVPDLDYANDDLKRIIEEWEEREAEIDREARYDARTRWYEDGCPRD